MVSIIKTKTSKTLPIAGYRRTFELILPNIARQQVLPGDFFRVEMNGAQLVLRPTDAVSVEQAWYWTSGWQERERQADSDIANKKISGPFRSAKDFMRGLKKK